MFAGAGLVPPGLNCLLNVSDMAWLRLFARLCLCTDRAVACAARLTYLLPCLQSQLPDVSVTKSVSPSSGVLKTIFTYTISL